MTEEELRNDIYTYAIKEHGFVPCDGNLRAIEGIVELVEQRIRAECMEKAEELLEAKEAHAYTPDYYAGYYDAARDIRKALGDK